MPQVPAAADVTVKSIENEPSRILVIGFPVHADRVVKALSKYMPTSPYWRSKLTLYSTVVGRVKGAENGKCIVEVDGIELELVNSSEECEPEKFVIGYVVKAPIFPGERGRLVEGVRVVGDYAMVYKSANVKVTFSEHISRADRRALLSSLALEYTNRGIGVHWRSSARDAEDSILREELKKLVEKLASVEEKAKQMLEEGRTGVVSEGERIYIYEISSIDKRRLDDIRDSILPTIPWHHSIKSLGDEKLNVIVDYAEKVLEIDRSVRSKLHEGLKLYIVDQLQGKRVRVHHVKLDGSVVELGVATVREARIDSGEISLILERHVRSSGVYDGLGVEKEPGDIIETSISTSRWYITHKYISRDGNLKGVYININTPPEIAPGYVRYIDLSVDVVKMPDGSVKIIDVEEFKKYVEEGVVPSELVNRVKEVVREIAGVELQI
ncbi:DUF402 domain-containing protein [Pyrolobus fumarii]|uniref:DUF402 domain-containing protein n=1 Tax=Pyrolobus fumarii TaxID=54252 RepID=UPI001432DE09|nr:DUF402 domain-containing protein [Pyrolobus fumarii]